MHTSHSLISQANIHWIRCASIRLLNGDRYIFSKICCIVCVVCGDRNYDRNRIHFATCLALFRSGIPSLGKSLRNVGILRVQLRCDLMYCLFDITYFRLYGIFPRRTYEDLIWNSLLWFSFYFSALVACAMTLSSSLKMAISHSKYLNKFSIRSIFHKFRLHIVNMSEFGTLLQDRATDYRK